MAFGSNKFSNTSKNFEKGISSGFKSHGDKPEIDFEQFDNPFKFTPKDDSLMSRIRFYDRDSLWARWRRGYELYTITQSVLSSFADQRGNYGDFRMYCAYQQYPGIFIPARIFVFPTSNQEFKQQIVGIRDANGFNFYNFGLSILGIRYLSDSKSATYTQSGTTLTISCANHGFQPGDSIYLNVTSGAAVSTTLPIATKTQDTFTCTAASPITTNGNVIISLSTTFGDNRWTQQRVKLRSLFNPIPSLIGERFVDRVVERDPGISGSYSRTTDTVTVNCSAPHGLATGNFIFANILGGSVTSKQYKITVTSSTQLTFNTIDSGVTAGSIIVNRLIPGYDYGNYVGYTLIGVDTSNTELIFQRADSYGAKTIDNKYVTTVPAERGFLVGRFLSTEIRYQCTCQDFIRREGYNLYGNKSRDKIPVTPITSTKPGVTLNKDNTLSPTRDQPGTFGDLGYITPTDGFYKLPNYADKTSNSYQNLYYYQQRWCKHIYAALFSINNDEGNTPIVGEGRYTQSGPNITISIFNHGLSANTKIQVNFTSGNAIQGEYTVTEVLDPNTFKIVYPFAGSANGYCSISNLKRHQFIDAWLLEPSDKPIGDDLDTFYKNFTKEHNRLRQAAERLSMMSHGMKWIGVAAITGDKNQPQQVANYSPHELSMLLSGNIRRIEGEFNVSGQLLNDTQRMAAMMSKLINIEPSQIFTNSFGMLDEPLYNYDPNYQYGLTDGGEYLNGVPYSVVGSSTTTSGSVTEDPNTVTVLDCGTYDPVIGQEFVVDAGPYIN